jgi:hypothetical protein
MIFSREKKFKDSMVQDSSACFLTILSKFLAFFKKILEKGNKMNRELLAPCGLYCGVCGVYMASRNNNQKLKDKLAVAYGVTPEQVACKGCLSNEKFVFCQSCGIRNCVMEKKYEGCHECEEFPCKLIDDFPVPVGKKVILRSVPARKKLGTEKWVVEEGNRYRCSHCGAPQFRGARRCGNCKESVEMD